MRIEQCNIEQRDRDELGCPAPEWAVGKTKSCPNSRCLCTIVIEEGDIGNLTVRPRGYYSMDPYEVFFFMCPNCHEYLPLYQYYPQPRWWQRLLKLL